MVNFGYAPLEPKIHDMDKADLRLRNWLRERDATFNTCIACGCCTATCTAGLYTTFSFREMCLCIQRGEVQKAFSESQKCMMCGKCTLVCPRDVNTRNILKLVRSASQKI